MVHQKDIDLFSVNCANVINGQIGFCACHSCGKLSGDCDFDYQCQEGLICGTNNCPETFGFDAHTDCCDTAILGDDDFCTTDKLCDINQGDCDSNDECKNHLFCGSNNCPAAFGFNAHTDCCYTDFCTIDEPCEVDKGDCDSNDECKNHLFCGSKNCPSSLGFLSSADCCEPKGDRIYPIIFQPLTK